MVVVNWMLTRHKPSWEREFVGYTLWSTLRADLEKRYGLDEIDKVRKKIRIMNSRYRATIEGYFEHDLATPLSDGQTLRESDRIVMKRIVHYRQDGWRGWYQQRVATPTFNTSGMDDETIAIHLLMQQESKRTGDEHRVCNNCGKLGHNQNQCKHRVATGVPRSELRFDNLSTEELETAMIDPASGRFCVKKHRIADFSHFDPTQHAATNTSQSSVPAPRRPKSMPVELLGV